MSTFLLIHGGWGGGWVWREVAAGLRRAGHDVFTPSLTGYAERVHLAGPEVSMDTHITDIANVIYYEELYSVILVGHSSGGMALTGAAERIPERLGHVVYWDAFLPLDGESAGDVAGPAVGPKWQRLMEQGVLGLPSGWLDAEMGADLQDSLEADPKVWRRPGTNPNAWRDVPHLLRPLLEPVSVGNPATAALPHTYVSCTSRPDHPVLSVLALGPRRARALWAGRSSSCPSTTRSCRTRLSWRIRYWTSPPRWASSVGHTSMRPPSRGTRHGPAPTQDAPEAPASAQPLGGASGGDVGKRRVADPGRGSPRTSGRQPSLRAILAREVPIL